MSWARRFDEPIPLPSGDTLETLLDAGHYINALPKPLQKLPAWEAACQALLVVIEHNGPVMLARIGMMQAINHSKPTPSLRRKRKPAKTYNLVT